MPANGRSMRMIRMTFTTLLAGLLLAALAGSTATATAKTGHYAIAAPKKNQVVSGIYFIRPHIKASKGHRFTVTVKIDGKVVKKRRGVSRKKAMRHVRVDTTKLKNGRHLLSVKVTSKAKPKRVKQKLKFVVANFPGVVAGMSVPVPAAPTGLPGTEPAPAKNLENFRIVASENFDKDAATGTWDPDSLPWAAPAYTGSTGVGWTAYPSTFLDTFSKHPYRAKEVLSVHGNVLDFNLHPVDGLDSGASISPILPGGSQYQTYGRYSMRVRVDSNIPQYHLASMLWPVNDSDYVFAESDFPEYYLFDGPANFDGYAHYGPTHYDQEKFTSPTISLSTWHVFTQEWMPGKRKFYVDGQLIHETSTPVWDKPERWQIQIERMTDPGSFSGHMLIDWAAVWAWSPGTPAG